MCSKTMIMKRKEAENKFSNKYELITFIFINETRIYSRRKKLNMRVLDRVMIGIFVLDMVLATLSVPLLFISIFMVF